MDKISVCLATYNGEKYIKKQLDTIIPQLRDQDEIIISDDGSSDNTVSIIQSLSDNRIILIKNKNKKSPVLNFENALKNASGNYIYLVDQDDMWYEGRIKKTQQLLSRYDLVVCDANIIDVNDKIISESFFKLNKSRTGFLRNLYKNSYLGCTMAFKRWLLTKVLPFPKNIPMHDWWIGLIGELYGRVYFLDETLVGYRRHTSNFSNTAEKSDYNIFRKTYFRLVILKNLLFRVCKTEIFKK